MNQENFLSSAWYQAITLTERIASLRAVQSKKTSVKVNADLAKQRLQRWHSQSPFATDSYFDQRLAMDGITEDELLILLSEPIEAVHHRFSKPPIWLAELQYAFSRPLSSNLIPIPENLRGKKTIKFLEVIKPLISQARDRLHKGIQELIQTQTNLPFDLSTIEDVLFANLPIPLLMMLNRTMVLELNVARLQELLNGDTPEERFNSFCQRIINRDVALSILQEYPVLVRQLTIRIDNWVKFSLEFLFHLCADWDAICTIFSSEKNPGLLAQLDGYIGDTHHGGRSVMIARFSSGFRLVYKPKPLAIEVHFQEFLDWLNKRGDHPPFHTLKILDRGTYGWVEFIATRGCKRPEEVQRFYERQGGYLALLYALVATDFHFENMIAVCEHPVLVDLESLFHSHIREMDTAQSDLLASSTMEYSVLRVGLLPQRIWSNAEYDGIDLSGLGAEAGQLMPDRISHLEKVGTDEMIYTRKRMKMPGAHNRPRLNDAEVNVMDYTQSIVDGFTTMYRLLMKNKNELLSDNGPLSRFAEDEVRIIVRPTRTYGLLLYESFHPDMLRNALDRDQFFDKLWVGIKNLPYLAEVIPAEHEDLQKGDIPMFTTQPNLRDIWSSSGKRITDFLDESGMTLTMRRIRNFSEEDLTKQLWFIRASLATLSMDMDSAKWPTYSLTEPQTITDSEQLLRAAQAVGDRLASLAIHGENDASWLGLTLINERYWSLTPLYIDLYSGISGIALFLAYLGAITQKERYTALSQAALATIRHQLESSESFTTSIGAFGGWGGVIYSLAHLGVLWDKPALLAEAVKIVKLLPDLIEQDEHLDIIGGAAGCIGGLISLYRCTPSNHLLAAAIQCGDRLITLAQKMEHGIGWTQKLAAGRALAGFSHGAAGMAWALLELAALTGEGRFRTAAIAAMDYERSLFSPEVGNWPDLRDLVTKNKATHDDRHNFKTAWCHGAPGIGLARLCSLQHFDDAKIRCEIDVALKTTITQGFGKNHCLCHGDLGNLELLLQASEIFDDDKLRFQVKHIATMILESIDKYGWLCGVPLGVETPGLMVGLAGIGYELLRLAEPERVPSVLTLEPPILHSETDLSTKLSNKKTEAVH